jgi:hypothetical protein
MSETAPVEVPMRRSLSNGRHAKRQSICYIVSLGARAAAMPGQMKVARDQ